MQTAHILSMGNLLNAVTNFSLKISIPVYTSHLNFIGRNLQFCMSEVIHLLKISQPKHKAVQLVQYCNTTNVECVFNV